MVVMPQPVIWAQPATRLPETKGGRLPFKSRCRPLVRPTTTSSSCTELPTCRTRKKITWRFGPQHLLTLVFSEVAASLQRLLKSQQGADTMKRISLLVLAYSLRAATAYGDGLSRTVQCVNNTNTDTGTINNAINDVCNPSANGGEVFILPGTCLINPHAQTFSLCSNLTIRGAGPKSFLQVAPSTGTYSTIFGGRTSFPVISNVVIKDFRIDQNPIGNPSPPGGNEGTGLHVIDLSVSISAASGVTVSGMVFDAVDGMH